MSYRKPRPQRIWRSRWRQVYITGWGKVLSQRAMSSTRSALFKRDEWTQAFLSARTPSMPALEPQSIAATLDVLATLRQEEAGLTTAGLVSLKDLATIAGSYSWTVTRRRTLACGVRRSVS